MQKKVSSKNNICRWCRSSRHTHIYTHLYAQYWISAFVCRTCGARKDSTCEIILVAHCYIKTYSIFSRFIQRHSSWPPTWFSLMICLFVDDFCMIYYCSLPFRMYHTVSMVQNDNHLCTSERAFKRISLEKCHFYWNALSSLHFKAKFQENKIRFFSNWPNGMSSIAQMYVKRKIGRYSLIILGESTTKENHKKTVKFFGSC